MFAQPGARHTQCDEVGVRPCDLHGKAEGDGCGACFLLNDLDFESLRASRDKLSGIRQSRLSLEMVERLCDLVLTSGGASPAIPTKALLRA